MQKNNQSDRLSKWVIKISEHDITYQIRPATKSHVLADFLIDFSPELEQDLRLSNGRWILHVDGSSSHSGSGVGIKLQSQTGELLCQSFLLGFKASNNVAEYETLITEL
ncbi:hypothetical protein N665_0084s0001 [Sinapis alba]|nr:hypothetical protein N665_0084s0001 [Sinapis alba]